MSTTNPRNIAPVPQFPERAGNTVDRIVARPANNEFGQRAGNQFFMEAHWKSPAISSDLVAGAGAAEVTFETKIGGQANGRVEPGASNPRPSWAAVDSATKAAFLRGEGVERGSATPYPWQPREGHNGAGHLSPLHGLNEGERPNTAFGRKQAPPAGGRARVNQADVTGRDV